MEMWFYFNYEVQIYMQANHVVLPLKFVSSFLYCSVTDSTISVDAERVIKAGGVYINHARVASPDTVLIPGQHILPNHITLIRVGMFIAVIYLAKLCY